MKQWATGYFVALLALTASPAIAQSGPPPGWVDLAQLDPTIRMDIRYATPNNFLGRRVEGYHAPRCWLARPAAEALVSVQAQLRASGQTLVVFDCYRPARAVADFNAWVPSSADDSPRWHPGVPRNELVSRGYIAARSGHSRGYTVDLAIGPRRMPLLGPRRSSVCGNRTDRGTLDFGTPFDCFHDTSGLASTDVSPAALANRQRLASLMDGAGFAGYAEEWWHFTLRARPEDAPWLDVEIR